MTNHGQDEGDSSRETHCVIWAVAFVEVEGVRMCCF